MYTDPGHLAPVLALALLVSAAGPTAAELSDDAFEQRLSEMQARADEALTHYEAGETEQALEDARFVRDQFSFEGTGSSELEDKIKAVSAVSIGDRVKAEASRFAAAIEAGEPVDEVRSIHDDLSPSLNRLVLVSQGKHAPASERTLKTDEAIESAAQEVRDLVDEAVRLYEQGDTKQAQKTADEAFFTFETNGLGPDTSTVDDPLENEVENLIRNFDRSSPNASLGLAGLIETNASLEEVQAQADRIHEGIDQIVEVLEATKPPRDIGDANQDGKVTIVDALLTAQASLGIRSTHSTMDANQDGSVSIVDALLISQAALGIRSL